MIWLPRPRGDAPFLIRSIDGGPAAPPPTRGCTRRSTPRRAGGDGSPAHAGMHPDREWRRRHQCWLPRPRGDAPSAVMSIPWALKAPPPTRGCTPLVSRCRSALQGSPAHAGMHPAPSPARSGLRRLPRPRGDAPFIGPGSAKADLAPPPTRGCTRECRDSAHVSDGSPAHAGMHPRADRHHDDFVGLPRPRGDAPMMTEYAAKKTSAPPPTRGCTRGSASCRGPRIGSPAHAGMHPASRALQTALRRLPRPRGDAPKIFSRSRPGEVAPPPTRGCTLVLARSDQPPLGSPAHAGMHPDRHCPRLGRLRLPRPRGDAPFAIGP